MPSAQPFDDIRALVAKFPGPDRTVAHIAAPSENGRGGDLLRWIAGWSGRAPRISRPLVAIFAATHGIAEQAQPGTAQRTREVVDAIAQGDGAVNRACAASDLGLKVFDLALEMPTADIAAAPALDERACAATLAFGMEAIAGGTDLLVLGSSGEGGEISAAALLAALHPQAVAEELELLPPAFADRIRDALARHAEALADPLEALRHLGGRETAAIAGAIIAARLEKVPVVLDGITAVAAAAVVARLGKGGIDHCVVGDRGAIGMQRAAVDALGLDHVLDIGFGEGDGAGGAIAVAALKAIVAAAEPAQPASGPH